MEERILVPFYDDVFQEFAKIYIEEINKLPHHINLIDELHANENAHSRIFNILIQYPEGQRYPLWESFVKNVLEIDLNIKAPKFSCEKGRIDILIKDDGYAIIIENKIHGAIDQGNQLESYIQKIKAEGYSNDQISVAYLTREGGQPGENSLSKSTKSKLKPCIEINYRDNILTWLDNHALPSCKYKDQLLISAIQQYIDHLKGMFNQRIIQENMEQRFEKFLDEKLELKLTVESTDLYRAMEILKDKMKIAESLSTTVRTMYENTRKAYYFPYWAKKIREDFPAHEKMIIDGTYKGQQFWGLKFEYRNTTFMSMILLAASKIYYVCRNGNNKWESGDDVDLLLKEVFYKKGLMKPNGSSNIDYCEKASDYESVYNLFRNNTSVLIAHINPK